MFFFEKNKRKTGKAIGGVEPKHVACFLFAESYCAVGCRADFDIWKLDVAIRRGSCFFG